jgi:fused signal recognition particle receptor
LALNFLRRKQIKEGLTKTRESFLSKLTNLALGEEKQVDEEFWTNLEETLIAADFGAGATIEIVDALRVRADFEHVRKASQVRDMLKEELLAILQNAGNQTPALTMLETCSKPFVYLIVGVNGSGKTTSIGKLARWFKDQKKSVLLAAGDTFRAAAIDQLKIWGDRAKVDTVAHQPGADPGAVAFDAWKSAKARNIDVVIVDTAGRLQAKTNLMKELEKTARALAKNDLDAPHETLLVVDAVTGQNGLSQAREFIKTVPLTGLILAKLDGSSKGGVVFGIAKELNLPIKFVGTGEKIDDFAEFDAQEFVDDLFER